MIIITTKNAKNVLSHNIFKSVKDLCDKYKSGNKSLELPSANDDVLSIDFQNSQDIKFADVFRFFDSKQKSVFSNKEISDLVELYQSNREDLIDLETRYLNDELEMGVEPSESFEQGYNNALEQVFRILNIPLDSEKSVSDESLFGLRVDIWVEDDLSLSKTVLGFDSIESAKSEIQDLILKICQEDSISDGYYSGEIEVTEYYSDSPSDCIYADGDEFSIEYKDGKVTFEI